ncbi:hypothetical protein AXF42_Ash006883 [Apostasia shenzhenica]|uniref:DUF4283 domain-containing protein n=1 Tax=Apostasia shenzhenica TaxID=1088818 RepID=A0A2I0BEK1_9ASPA|nr:hypothetical protein AXF42_Ash006883 [Apostasia shenzhenica]
MHPIGPCYSLTGLAFLGLCRMGLGPLLPALLVLGLWPLGSAPHYAGEKPAILWIRRLGEALSLDRHRRFRFEDGASLFPLLILLVFCRLLSISSFGGWLGGKRLAARLWSSVPSFWRTGTSSRLLADNWQVDGFKKQCLAAEKEIKMREKERERRRRKKKKALNPVQPLNPVRYLYFIYQSKGDWTVWWIGGVRKEIGFFLELRRLKYFLCKFAGSLLYLASGSSGAISFSLRETGLSGGLAVCERRLASFWSCGASNIFCARLRVLFSIWLPDLLVLFLSFFLYFLLFFCFCFYFLVALLCDQLKSFSDIVKNCVVAPVLVTVDKKPYMNKDAITFSYTKDEIQRMTSPFELSLVGKFVYGRPDLSDIRRFFVSLKGGCSFGLMNNRHLSINFCNPEDFHRLWEKQLYYVERCPMKLSKWYPGFRVEKESPICPVLINFLRIPVEFGGEVMNWASVFGKPVKMDEATIKFLKPCSARVLVEMDVSIKHLEEFWVDVEGKEKYLQKVVFENKLLYCSHCFKLGHNLDNCFVRNPDLK